MLTFEENRWNFKALKILSQLNFLPIQIDENLGRIQRQRNKLRLYFWRISYFIGVADSLYLFARLLQSIREPEKYFTWAHFVIHFMMTGGYSVLDMFGWCLFFVNSTECIIVFNQVFGRKETSEATTEVQINADKFSKGTKDTEEIEMEQTGANQPASQVAVSQIRPLFKWPPQYSLHELLALVIPVIPIVTAPLAMGVLAMDSSRIQLIYNTIPESYKNNLTCGMCWGLETFFLMYHFFFVIFGLLIEVEFLDDCEFRFRQLESQLRNMINTVGDKMWKEDGNMDLNQILKEMKTLELCIEFFNRTFPSCVLAFKLLCLALTTFGFFFTIRHNTEHPLLVLFTGYVGIIHASVYIILYEKAFSVPEKMEGVKNLFLVAAKSSSTSRFIRHQPNSNPCSRWKQYEREIWSIRSSGIKVGNFHTMERMSIPIFLNFVVIQVVNLLVLFPQL